MSLLLLFGSTSGSQSLSRTTSDSLGSITETVRNGTLVRSVAQTLGAIAEWVTAVGSRTRLYLPSSGAAAVNPALLAWDETTGFDRIRAVRTRSGTAMATKAQAHTATAAGKTYLSRMYVSDPIAAQTIPVATVKGTLRVFESAINDNLDAFQIAIRVVSNDGSTFRSPNIYGPANGTVAEFNTALRAKRLAVGGASSSVVTSAGDRIVIEIATTNTTVGVSLSDTISYGDNSATDLGDNETDTSAFNPFIEISTSITFAQTLARIAGETVGAIADAPSKVAAHPRTSADTVGAITANVVAIATPAPPTFTRNAGSGDSIATLTASASRIATHSQGIAVTLGAVSETPVKVKILPRTTSATLATLTEAVTRAGALIRFIAAALAGFIWGQTAWGAGAYGPGGIAESLVRTVVTGTARAVADSLAAITESITRLGTFGRTVAQTMGAITEAVIRVAGAGRTAGDALATLSEAVARAAQALVRTVAETMGSITESVSWAANAFLRTVAQTMGSITESVGRGASTFGRSAADTISTITEAVSRLAGLPRTAADSLGAISEAIVRIVAPVRTVAQTLGAITEAVATSSFAVVRTVADSLPSISETIARIGGFGRSVAQTLGAIVESIANGSQVVGGVPPVVTSALYSVARGLGYSPTPTGSASGPKPRD